MHHVCIHVASLSSSDCMSFHLFTGTSFNAVTSHQKQIDMKRNVGKLEKWVRIGAGAALVGLYMTRRTPRNAWGNASLAVGGELLATGLVGYCPVNHALGANTHRKRTAAEQMTRMHRM